MPKTEKPATPLPCWCNIHPGWHFWHDTTCPPEPVARPLSD